MMQGHVVRTSGRNRVTSSEHRTVTGSRRPNIERAIEIGRKFGAPDPALTCANTRQGQEGQVIRNFPSRTRVTCARQKVPEHLTLLTLPTLQTPQDTR